VFGVACTVERPVNDATVPFTIDAAAEYVTPVLKAVLEGTPVDAVLSRVKEAGKRRTECRVNLRLPELEHLMIRPS